MSEAASELKTTADILHKRCKPGENTGLISIINKDLEILEPKFLKEIKKSRVLPQFLTLETEAKKEQAANAAYEWFKEQLV